MIADIDAGALRRQVLEALAQAVPGAGAVLFDPARPFRDQVEMDSVDLLNFIPHIEKILQVKVPEEEFFQFSTLDGCLAWLSR